MRKIQTLSWLLAGTLGLWAAGCSGTPIEETPSQTPATPTLAVTATPSQTPATQTPGATPTATVLPVTDTPGTSTPGTSTPGTSTPGTDTPGTETPGTSTPGLTPTATPGTTPTNPPDVTPTATPVPSTDLDGDGYTVGEGDCDDADKTIHPDAVDVPYDGIDQDCLEGDLVDVDGDGYNGVKVLPDDELDCNDEDENINPAAAEVCDGVDQDCDELIDDGVLVIGYQDLDKDGYGSSVSSATCTLPTGYVTKSGDCNDNDQAINPGAAEVCDSKDNDCDTLADDADPSLKNPNTWYRDADGDTYGDKNNSKSYCLQPSGYVANSTDCNDTDNKINPAASEVCDSKDNDCDSLIDDADSNVAGRNTWYKDGDADGYGDKNVTALACAQPAGYVSNSADCNDANKAISPAATEICDGLDNNCNGTKDEGVTATTYYNDADGDGYGNASVSTVTCTVPIGYVPVAGDCLDTNKNVYPGAPEVCNGLDDNCNSGVDEEGAANSCPDTGTECKIKSCTGGSCTTANVQKGTKISTQTPSDCQANVCDGAGGTSTQADDFDLPVDDNMCTQGACTNGSPSQLPLTPGTACDQNGGVACGNNAQCLPGIAALRIGSGSAALTNAASPLNIEYRLTDGTLMTLPTNPLPLPTVAATSNQPITLSGTKTAEGALTLSADGHYLVLAGYAATPGTANVAASKAVDVNRVVGRVNASLEIDTSTRINNAYSEDSVRGATSMDGTSFWLAGTSGGTSPTGGVQYVALGGTASTQISAAPNNVRLVNIFNGQLYATAATTGAYGVSTVGTGLPTTTGQTSLQLPGMPSVAGISPYGTAMFDRNPNVAGLDTLYLADDRSIASGGGVQKWTFDGTTWTLAATYTTGLTTGLRGLAAIQTGNSITLVGSTSDTSLNKLVSGVDDGVNAPTFTVIATSPTNTLYRGVAPAPK